MDYLVYFYYVVLFALLFIGARWYGKGSWNDGFLSLSETKAWQGFFAVCIMLHHAGQKTCAPWHAPSVIVHGLDGFVPVGYWFVGVFLFASGYGLYTSFHEKENYLQGFFKRRVLPMIIVFYSTAWIFILVRFLLGEKIGVWQMIYYVTGLQLANPNAWYVIALPIFYGFFYLAFRFCKRDGLAIFLTCLGVFLYTCLGTMVDHNNWWMRGEWWYNSVHMFSIGILFARFKEPIVNHVKRHYGLYLTLCVLGTFVFYITSEWAQNVFSYYGENWGAPDKVFRRWMCLLTQMGASCFFVFSVYLLQMKLAIGNKLLALLGTVTLEFYMIHGLFVELFGYSFVDERAGIYYIKNVALFLTVVILLTIPSTWLLKKLTSFVRTERK